MTYIEYPKTDKEALIYAQQVAENKGEKRHAIRLTPNNPYGITHAVCPDEELQDYLRDGCTLIKP